MSSELKLNVQLAVAVALAISGVTLLFCGFWVNPTGIIDNSVLIAFGEISAFSGGLFGIDYTYKYRDFLKTNKNGYNKRTD